MQTDNHALRLQAPLWRELLSQIPVAAYTCDAMGRLTYFNSLAAAVWGRTATLRDSAQRFCGSYRMYSPDGAPVPHNECGMARALLEGRPYNGYEVVIEQENGKRTPAVACESGQEPARPGHRSSQSGDSQDLTRLGIGINRDAR
jgi:hypothetical protein